MKNNFIVEGEIVKVYANGKHKDVYFLIDKSDLGLIANHSWRIYYNHTYRRVETTINIYGKGSVHCILSRFLTNPPEDKYVDHENCNPLDNRRINLRIADRFENSQNAPKTSNKRSSRYKGVAWHKHKNKWIVCIQADGTKHHLGYFVDENEAAKSYDIKAKELFSKFARLNFPENV